MKKSKTYLALCIFFIWAALKSLGSMLGAADTADYVLLDHLGLGYLFFLLTAPLMVAEAAVAWLLVNQRPQACIAGSLVVLAEVLVAGVLFVISYFHLDELKAVGIALREARGRTTDPELVNAMLTPGFLVGMAAVYLVFYALVWFGLRRVRPEIAAGKGGGVPADSR